MAQYKAGCIPFDPLFNLQSSGINLVAPVDVECHQTVDMEL